MADAQFQVKKAAIILGLVAVVAVASAILTAEHVGPVTLLIIALIAGLGGLILYGWIAGEVKKLQKLPPARSKKNQPDEE